MTVVKRIAQTLVELCRSMAVPEAQATLFHENAVNLERMAALLPGLPAIIAKEQAFLNSITERLSANLRPGCG